jgi:hypothetical protein
LGDQIAFAQIHAAGESDAPVHHHDFAVIAQIHAHQPPRRHGRQEASRRHAGMMQGMDDRRHGVMGAGGVNQNAHLHPAFHRLAQAPRQRRPFRSLSKI